MSDIDYLGVATVATTSPLTVRMPRATKPQPAATLGGTTPGVGATVLIVILAGGATYLLGTPPATTAVVTAQDVLVPGLDGSVWRVTVGDSVGTLKTTKVS